jgi:hypothetical protein
MSVDNQFDLLFSADKTKEIEKEQEQQPKCAVWRLKNVDAYRYLDEAFKKSIREKRDENVFSVKAAEAKLCNYAVAASNQWASKNFHSVEPNFICARFAKDAAAAYDDIGNDEENNHNVNLSGFAEEVLMCIYYSDDGSLMPVARASFPAQLRRCGPVFIKLSIFSGTINPIDISESPFRALFEETLARCGLAPLPFPQQQPRDLVESGGDSISAANTIVEMKSDDSLIGGVASESDGDDDDEEDDESEVSENGDNGGSFLERVRRGMKSVVMHVDALVAQYRALATSLAQIAVHRVVLERTGKRVDHLTSTAQREEVAKSITETSRRYLQKLWPYDRRVLVLDDLSFALTRAEVDASRRYGDEPENSAAAAAAVANDMRHFVRRVNEQQRVLFGAQQALKSQLGDIERTEATLFDAPPHPALLTPYIETRGMLQLPSMSNPAEYVAALRAYARALDARIALRPADFFEKDLEQQANAVVPAVLANSVTAAFAAIRRRELQKRQHQKAVLRNERDRGKRQRRREDEEDDDDDNANKHDESSDDEEEEEDQSGSDGADELLTAVAVDPRCLKPKAAKDKQPCVELLREDGEMLMVYAQRGENSIDDLTPSGRRDIVLRVANPFAPPGDLDNRWVVKFIDSDADRELHRYLASRDDTRRYIVPLARGDGSVKQETAATAIVSGRFLGESQWRPVKVTHFWEDTGAVPSDANCKRGESLVQAAINEFAEIYPTLIDAEDNDWSSLRNRITDKGHYRYYDFDCSTFPRRARPGGGGKQQRNPLTSIKHLSLTSQDTLDQTILDAEPALLDSLENMTVVIEEEETNEINPAYDDIVPVARYTVPTPEAFSTITAKGAYDAGATEASTYSVYTHSAAERYLADSFIAWHAPPKECRAKEENCDEDDLLDKDDLLLGDDDNDNDGWKALFLAKYVPDGQPDAPTSVAYDASQPPMWLLFGVVRSSPSLRLMLLARGTAESHDPHSAVEIVAYDNASEFPLGAQSKTGKDVAKLIKSAKEFLLL